MNDFEFSFTETEPKPTQSLETETGKQALTPAPLPVSQPEKRLPASPDPEQTTGTVLPEQTTNALAFSCVLIPRFGDHYLVGDVAGLLPSWIQQICISYGWRLEAIVVRPGYLHWVMTVPFSSNPAHFMRLVRQQTSQKIFEDFPRFKQLNISSDFWAPGSFVVAGNQQQSLESINSFIATTRKYQGIF